MPDGRCAARSSTAPTRGVPWGISESAYNVVDRHDTYQYKAFGVPGLGLKRGLGDELVVAPYATALAAMIDPPRSAAQPAAAERGRRSRATTASSTRSTTRAREPDQPTTPPRRAQPAPARSSAPTSRTTPGMTLVALANALLGDRDGRALSRRPARAGDRAAAAGARAAPRADDRSRGRSTRCASPRRRRRRRCGATARRTPSFPHAQFLSNGNYVTVVTNAGGGSSFCRGLRGDAVAARRDARPGQPVRLPARRPQRRRLVGDLPPDGGASRTTTSSTFRADARDLPPRTTTTSRRSSTSPSRPKTTSRCAACTVVNHEHADPRDRRHQLRRDRAGAAGRRSRAPGLRQAVHRDRVPGRQRGAALPSPAARSARPARVGGPRR